MGPLQRLQTQASRAFITAGLMLAKQNSRARGGYESGYRIRQQLKDFDLSPDDLARAAEAVVWADVCIHIRAQAVSRFKRTIKNKYTGEPILNSPFQKAFDQAYLQWQQNLIYNHMASLMIWGEVYLEKMQIGNTHIPGGLRWLNPAVTAPFVMMGEIIRYDYTEADNLTTSNALRLGLQLNRDLTDRWYVGLANTFTYDELAALDYRYQPSLALGYRLWKSERGELTVEAGPGYTWERQGGVVDDYATIRFAERFRFTLSENARILQSLEYLPQIDDFGRYLLVAEAALTTRIVGNLWWRTAVRNIYNSEPPIGLKQNDLQLVTGLTWGLGDPEATATKKKVRRKSDVVKPAAAPSRPEGVWQTTAALGFSLTKGNADNLMVLGDITSNMISAPHEYSLNIGGGYGEVNSASTVNFFRAGAQYNRQLTDRFYVGATANYLTDSIADLDYRLAPYGLLGYKVINTDTLSLRFEGGPGYLWEKQGGVARDFISLLARSQSPRVA